MSFSGSGLLGAVAEEGVVTFCWWEDTLLLLGCSLWVVMLVTVPLRD